MEIFKKYTFDSAHFLPNVPEGHKCKTMHGHTYHLTLYFEGELNQHFGWIMDFNDIKKIIAPIIEKLDHKVLNTIPGLENPTCELISTWLWNNIKPQIELLSKIELHETPTSGAIYIGN
jgi:6-pyruvoyltetrahydropterin/6-carboxytetrahydropterin synthase